MPDLVIRELTQLFVGKKHDDNELKIQALIGRGPKMRVMRFGSSYTLEVRPYRLNIVVNEDGVITNFYFG